MKRATCRAVGRASCRRSPRCQPAELDLCPAPLTRDSCHRSCLQPRSRYCPAAPATVPAAAPAQPGADEPGCETPRGLVLLVASQTPGTGSPGTGAVLSVGTKQTHSREFGLGHGSSAGVRAKPSVPGTRRGRGRDARGRGREVAERWQGRGRVMAGRGGEVAGSGWEVAGTQQGGGGEAAGRWRGGSSEPPLSPQSRVPRALSGPV